MDSEGNAKRVLAPLHEMIRKIIDSAFEKWNALPDETKSDMNRFPRTRANVLWSLIVGEASRMFMSVGEIEESGEEEQQRVQTVTYTVRLNDIIVVFRFKKMSISGETRNVMTARQLNFISQLEMPGLPDEAIRVSIGYVENETATGALHVLVKHEDRDDEWTYEIPSVDVVSLPERAAKKAAAEPKKPKREQVQRRKDDAESDEKEDTLETE
jgi:hypothetical protein